VLPNMIAILAMMRDDSKNRFHVQRCHFLHVSM
jgi:hypothetical protein